MGLITILAIAYLAHKGIKHAKASPISLDDSSRPCTTFKIPVPVTAHNHVYDVVHVDNNIDAVNYELDVTTWDNPSFFDRIVKNITISKTYDIHAQLCVPPNGSKKSHLQLATHGAGFDSRYWDSEVEPSKYSYVEAALEAGYSILTYDRIGCGRSSKPNAYTEVQAPAEVEVLRGISEIVRSGKLSSHVPDSFDGSLEFEKIIHVGHSFGSFTTYVFTSLYPELSDAAVITGFLFGNESNMVQTVAEDLRYAPEDDPKLFADSSSGYIIPGTQSALQAGFFSSRADKTTGTGGFDPKLLEYAYSIRQPLSVTELGSAAVLIADNLVAPQYTGPVQFIAGEFDFLECLGDCRNTYDLEQLKMMYPKAKDINIYLQPGTGHGLPFHRGARSSFQVTFDWLNKNGL